MGFFDNFPYTNFHELNLDWLLKEMLKLRSYVENYTALNNVSYAGVWDITKQYTQWAVVSNGDSTYMSKKPVPAGIAIENEEFWIHLADLDPRISGIISELDFMKQTNPKSNVKLYGAKGDGVADDTKAIKRAIIENKGGSVFFPAGTYRLNESLTVDGAFSLYGEGSDVSRLVWDNNISSGGLLFNMAMRNGTESDSVSVHDVYFGYAGDKDFTAITFNGAESVNERFTSRPIVRNVIVGPNDGYVITNGWNSAIELVNCNGAVVTESSLFGRVNSTGCGIKITSNKEPHGTEFLFDSLRFGGFGKGVFADVFEGIEIYESVFLTTEGVIAEGTANYPHLVISGCHFNTTSLGVNIVNCKECFVTNNLFYLSSKVETSCVTIGTSTKRFFFNNNIVSAEYSTTSVYPLVVRGVDGLVCDNRFICNGKPAILVQSPSSNVNFYGNSVENGALLADTTGAAKLGADAGRIVNRNHASELTYNNDIWIAPDGRMMFKFNDQIYVLQSNILS